jgi:hypothetical protein
MKRNFFLLACLISTQVFSQTFERDSLIGEWVCTEVAFASTEEFNDPEMKPIMEKSKKVFINSRFTFKSDGIFTLKLAKEQAEIAKGIDFLNNKKWFFNKEVQSISIGTPQENLMRIEVKQGDGFLSFLLSETPVILKMIKG